MSRLKEKYLNEVRPALRAKFEYDSVMQIPQIGRASWRERV